MGAAMALEATVTDEGLVLAPETLDRIGARPGDRVVVELRPVHRLKSMMGFGSRPDAETFTGEDLRQVRREMGAGLGEHLSR